MKKLLLFATVLMGLLACVQVLQANNSLSTLRTGQPNLLDLAAIDDPLSGAYTVGKTEADFANFVEVKTALITRGISGPVIFNIKDGIYTDSLNLDQAIVGSSKTNTITFQSESADTAKVTWQVTAIAATNFVVKSVVSNIIFKNLTFKSVGTNCIIMDFVNAGNIHFEGNHFVGRPSITSFSASTITFNFSVNNGSVCDSFTFKNNNIEGGSRNINFSGTASTGMFKNIHILNNTFYNNCGSVNLA